MFFVNPSNNNSNYNYNYNNNNNNNNNNDEDNYNHFQYHPNLEIHQFESGQGQLEQPFYISQQTETISGAIIAEQLLKKEQEQQSIITRNLQQLDQFEKLQKEEEIKLQQQRYQLFPNQELYKISSRTSLLPISPISSPLQPSSQTIPIENLKLNQSQIKKHTPSPPISPLLMSAAMTPAGLALGNPNRSCISCKRRKVKCDRKTPSCSTCQKSKSSCYYTSYSPPALLSELQSRKHQQEVDEGNGDLYEIPKLIKQEEHDFIFINEDILAQERTMIKELREKLEQVQNEGKERWEHMQQIYMEIKEFQQQQEQLLAYFSRINNSQPLIIPDTMSLYNQQQEQLPLFNNTENFDEGMLRLVMENPIKPSSSITMSSEDLIPRTTTTLQTTPIKILKNSESLSSTSNLNSVSNLAIRNRNNKTHSHHYSPYA
ncbi:hypothetical protein G9A89_004882 [Geosiphon pyriformis]|nr:hypothetical protein G9A89_004882 [Geosiphon pyriformis]